MVKFQKLLHGNILNLVPNSRFNKLKMGDWRNTIRNLSTKKDLIDEEICSLKSTPIRFHHNQYFNNNYVVPCSSSFPFEINSKSLCFFNQLQQTNGRKICIQPIATLKTYTFNTPKIKYYKQKRIVENKGFFETIRKLFRETIKVKTKKTILKKKRPCHLNGEEQDAAVFSHNEFRTPSNLGKSCSVHILKQSENIGGNKRNSPLNCPCYIPCPLPQPEGCYLISSGNKYSHTSLAPLFMDDPTIAAKDNASNQLHNVNNTIKKKCISSNFWAQFPSDQIKTSTDYERSLNYCPNNNVVNLVTKLSDAPSNQSVLTESYNENSREVKEKVEFKTEASDNKVNVEVQNQNCSQNKGELTPAFNSDNNKLPQENDKRVINLEEEIEILKSNIFKNKEQLFHSHKNINPRDKQIKHLNLNFPNRMTAPTTIKQMKKIQSTDNVNKNSIKGKYEKVAIPKYTNNKLLKQLKQYYENNNSIETGTNVNTTNNKNDSKTSLKKLGTQSYPLTSPNNNMSKNKS